MRNKLPNPTLHHPEGYKPEPYFRAVVLTRDGRRALNGYGPQLSSELGSRHRRMRWAGPVTMPDGSQWPEHDLVFSFDGRREAPKGNGLRYSFDPRYFKRV